MPVSSPGFLYRLYESNDLRYEGKEYRMVDVKKIAVLGAGTMGNGIAQVFAQAGFSVKMRDLEERFLESGLATIRKSLAIMSRKGKISESEADAALARITPTVDFEQTVRDSDLVIEAIPEVLQLKQDIFRQLNALCPPHTVMATNTSTISITAIASVTTRPDKVIGIHFAAPVPLMVGIEIIRGLDTSEDTFQVSIEMVRRIGKEYYVSRDSAGFIGNRALMVFLNEAFNTLWEGIATAEDIDKTAKLSFNHPMGSLELADFIGLDVVLDMLNYLHRELGERYRPSPMLKQLVAAGHLGRKTGRGVHVYE